MLWRQTFAALCMCFIKQNSLASGRDLKLMCAKWGHEHICASQLMIVAARQPFA